MRALVTGGAGFIGSTLVDRLLAEGHTVDVVDNLSTGSLANLATARAGSAHHFSFQRMDIRDPAVVEVVQRRHPEVVFHLAAQADVRVSVERPAFDAEVNVLGSIHILEGARLGGLPTALGVQPGRVTVRRGPTAKSSRGRVSPPRAQAGPHGRRPRLR